MVKNIPRGYLVVHSPLYLVTLFGQLLPQYPLRKMEKANVYFLHFFSKQMQKAIIFTVQTMG